jgi:hypothetical protein
MAPPLLTTEPLIASVPEAAVVPVEPEVTPLPTSTVPLAPPPAVVPATAPRVPLVAKPVVPPLTEPDDAPLPLLPELPEYDPPPQSTSDKGTAATSGANHINQPCFIFTGSPK